VTRAKASSEDVGIAEVAGVLARKIQSSEHGL
jgi:hypothetical protein